MKEITCLNFITLQQHDNNRTIMLQEQSYFSFKTQNE